MGKKSRKSLIKAREGLTAWIFGYIGYIGVSQKEEKGKNIPGRTGCKKGTGNILVYLES